MSPLRRLLPAVAWPCRQRCQGHCGTLGSFCALLEPQATAQGELGGPTGILEAFAAAVRRAGNFAAGGTRSSNAPRSALLCPRLTRRCGHSTVGCVHSCLPPLPPPGDGTGFPRPAGSTPQQPGSLGPESLRRGKFGGGGVQRLRRPGSERRGHRWQRARPPLPSPAPPKFGSPAIFLAPLPCEA